MANSAPMHKSDFRVNSLALRVAMTRLRQTPRSLAERYGCSPETIRRVLRNPLQSPLIVIFLSLTLDVPISEVYSYCPDKKHVSGPVQ